MASIRIVSVPYDLGHRDFRMGAGPTRILRGGAEPMLADAGHEVRVQTVVFAGPSAHEVGATFGVNRLVAKSVKNAVDANQFPIVLAGNCNSCIGTLAGIGSDDLGIIWFDAHGDYHSADTTGTGFFDGMALNIATGGSWQVAAQRIAGFTPVAQKNACLIGVRDLEPGEQDLLERSDLTVIDLAALNAKDRQERLVEELQALAERVSRLYVHVDLDVMDRDIASANSWAPPGGLDPDVLDEVLAMIGELFTVSGAAIASFDPETDKEGNALDVALDVLERYGEFAVVKDKASRAVEAS